MIIFMASGIMSLKIQDGSNTIKHPASTTAYHLSSVGQTAEDYTIGSRPSGLAITTFLRLEEVAGSGSDGHGHRLAPQGI